MAVVRVCYKSGARFDEDYYMSRHMPLAMRIMEPFGLTNAEVMRVGANPDGSLPPYQMIFTGHFGSAAQLQQAMASPGMQEVLADIPNYYDGSPADVFVGELLPLPALR